MVTFKKRLARLRRRILHRPKTATRPKTLPPAPSQMTLKDAENLARKRLNEGLKELAKHPRAVRADALSRVAKHLLTRRKLDDALRVNDLALACIERPKYHAQRANIFHAMGRTSPMIASARTAHTLDPLDHRAVRTLATFAPASLSPTRAMERLIYASADPGRTAARAALAMSRAGRPVETLRAMKRILERVDLSPEQRDQVEYHAGLAAEFSSPRSAMKYYRISGPEGSHWTHLKALGMSRCHLALGRLEEARNVIPDSDPYCPTRIEANLALGRMEEAHGEYRLRPQALQLARAFRNFLAEGERRLVLSEGGVGDEIRLTSLLKDISAASATCDPRLQSLLSRSFPGVNFIPVSRSGYAFGSRDHPDRRTAPFSTLAHFMNDQAVSAAKDADGIAGYLDLLARLRPSREAFPRTSHLIADPARMEQWKRFLPKDRPNVAVSWRSLIYAGSRSPHHLDAGQLEALKDVNAHFWLVQPGILPEEHQILRDTLGANIPPLLDVRNDLEGQAALLGCMDAMVGPYNTSAELAGAVGVPTFMMALAPTTQWRRNPDGSDVWHGSGRVICGTSDEAARKAATALNAFLISEHEPARLTPRDAE